MSHDQKSKTAIVKSGNILSAGAEGEAPCRVEAGAESEEKSPERVDLPTGPTGDGLRARGRTHSKTIVTSLKTTCQLSAKKRPYDFY